jgi:hypothetical protein
MGSRVPATDESREEARRHLRVKNRKAWRFLSPPSPQLRQRGDEGDVVRLHSFRVVETKPQRPSEKE